MPPFLELLSEKLLERWLNVLLPGAVFVATVLVAVVLGHRHWADLELLADTGDRAAAEWAARSGLATVTMIAAAVAGAAAAGAAVRAIGAGLRALHDALPVYDCPFSWTAEDRLARAHRMAAEGLLDTGDWHPDFAHLTLDEALSAAADPPPVDRLVVCHGDACAPNTLVGDDGRWTGHVDLARMGRGDRWADLAIASWSLGWNFGPGWEPDFYAAYGIEPDPERIHYYRLLWELGG